MLNIAGVLVIGRAGTDTERPEGYNTEVVALTTTTDVVCATGISTTCSVSICNTAATGLEVRKTTDNTVLSIGGVIIFECLITSMTSFVDGTQFFYQQGDPAEIIPFVLTLVAECAQTEYFNDWVVFQFSVSRSGAPVIGQTIFTNPNGDELRAFIEDTT